MPLVPLGIPLLSALAWTGAALDAWARASRLEALTDKIRQTRGTMDRYGTDGQMPLFAQEVDVDNPLQAMAREFLRSPITEVPDDLLLATLLAGASREDPIAVARRLLAKNALEDLSRRSVFEATPHLGDVGWARVLAAHELARRAEIRAATRTLKVLSPQAAVDVLRTTSRGPREQLSALYLGRRLEVLGVRVLSEGSAAFTIVDPIEVLRPAIELRAARIVLAHQHPSGDPTPSRQDYEVTERVAKAAKALGLALIDHLVLTPTEYRSMSEMGTLPSEWPDPLALTGP